MELQDPCNRKMQSLIAFLVSAGIHLAGLLALLSIDACGKAPSGKDAVDGIPPKGMAGSKEVDAAQKGNRHSSSAAPGEQPTPPGSIDPSAPQEERERGPTNLVVRAGDTLWTIARRCKSTPDKLAEMNGTNAKTLSSLRVGQILKVPVQ